MSQKSSFDRVRGHLLAKGCRTPAAGELRDDLELLVRRCDDVCSRGGAYSGVELSPYMTSLLRVSTGLPAAPAMKATMVASV